MRRATRFVLVLGLGLGAGAPVFAEHPPVPPPPLAEAHGDLDGDGRPERVQLTAAGVVEIDDASGHLRGQVALPLKSALGDAQPRRGSIAVAQVAGHPLAHATVALGGGRALEALITLDAAGAHLLDAERTGPVGDGERSIVIGVDAHALARWQTSPTEVRCDGEARLFYERFNFERARFEPVDLDVPDGTPLAATTTPPPALGHRPLGIFHFVAESTDPSASGERRADYLAAPHELEDGTLRTTWVAGAPGEGRGAWVAARSSDPHHLVTAVRIAPGPGPTPRKLTLFIGPQKRFALTWPEGGGPLYAVLPRPEPADCVAVAIAGPPPKAGSPGTSLAEISIYTDADTTGGLAALADEVARGGPGADGAAQVLASHGQRATQVVAAALPTASGSGHRRLVEILSGLDDPQAAPALGHALETAAASERAPLVAGLARLGSAGETEAARIFADEGQAEDARADAAAILGRISGGAREGADAAQKALLDGAGRGPITVRSATGRALALAAAKSPPLLAALTSEVARPPSSVPLEKDEERLGDLGRALGQAAHGAPPKLRGDAQAALVAAYARGGGFALELRLLRAIGDLGLASPQALALLSRVAARDPDEVLRFTAVQAAAALDADAGRAILRAAADDRDPEVRRTALIALSTRPDGGTAPLLVRALSTDAWPLVRSSAAEGLRTSCTAAGVTALLARVATGSGDDLRGADRSEPVRRAALGSLGHCAPRDPAIARALESRNQPASVRELAAALVAKSGDPQAGPTLARALVAVLADPASDERSAGLAVSLTRALGRTGDRSEPVLEALGAASNEPLVPAIRAAAMESIGKLCPSGSRVALERGAADRDGTVRRAARQALLRCRQ